MHLTACGKSRPNSYEPKKILQETEERSMHAAYQKEKAERIVTAVNIATHDHIKKYFENSRPEEVQKSEEVVLYHTAE